VGSIGSIGAVGGTCGCTSACSADAGFTGGGDGETEAGVSSPLETTVEAVEDTKSLLHSVRSFEVAIGDTSCELSRVVSEPESLDFR
jgi:hypothetical protein